MEVSASKIKKFYECTAERECRIHQSIFKGVKWGTVCEKLIGIVIENPGRDLFQAVQQVINDNYPQLSTKASVIAIKNLITTIRKVTEDFSARFSRANVRVNANGFSAQIDFLLTTSAGEEFPLEVKSYPSPGFYAFNSDIIQLTVQNLALSNQKTEFYYGQIAYLGDGRLVEVYTRPFNQAVTEARLKILTGENTVSCPDCIAFNVPCYKHIRVRTLNAEISPLLSN